MKKKSFFVKAGSCVVALSLVLPFCSFAQELQETQQVLEKEEKPEAPEENQNLEGNQNLEDAKDKKNELEGHLAEARQAVKELSESELDARQKYDKLQTKLDALSGEEDRASENLKDLAERITDSKAGLAEARKAADAQYEQMKSRIRYMYENGAYRVLDIVFSSGNLAELFKSVEYISAVYSYDREMLEAYQGYLKAIKKRTGELKQEYLEAEEMKTVIADRHAAVSVLLDAQNAEIEKIDGQLSEAQKQKREYELEVAAQNEALLAIQAEIARQAAEEEARRAEEEARRRAEEEARKQAEEAAKQKALDEAKLKEEPQTSETESEEDSSDVVSEDISEDESYEEEDTVIDDSEEEWEGGDYEEDYEEASASASGFIWPCPASHTITSEYGTREAPTAGASTDHRGIDIGAPMGSAIVAAQSGTVITATYSASGGNMIIISHGKNSDGDLVCTAYMHASELYVSVGDEVSQGQTIAAVGSTGYSTGPHLHFGVTVGGSYVNPHSFV